MGYIGSTWGDSILKARIIMASRRVSASTVDWAAFALKIPAAQKASFTALKQKSDGFMRAVNALPAAAPKIDFETYKSKVAVAGMVDDFQKKYEALDIPYPADNVSASLDTQLATKKAEYGAFVVQSAAKIAEIEVGLQKWEKMRPIEEMKREEAIAQMPHLVNQLKIRDPAQHKHSIGPEYTETYDQWEARMLERQKGIDAEHAEAEERAKKERAKMGLDY